MIKKMTEMFVSSLIMIICGFLALYVMYSYPVVFSVIGVLFIIIFLKVWFIIYFWCGVGLLTTRFRDVWSMVPIGLAGCELSRGLITR